METENNESEVIVAIREEYEKKLEQQKEELNKEKEEALRQSEEKHIAQIRALMSGREENIKTQSEVVKEELTFEENELQDLRNKFKL